jgi:hypothetical protein
MVNISSLLYCDGTAWLSGGAVEEGTASEGTLLWLIDWLGVVEDRRKVRVPLVDLPCLDHSPLLLPRPSALVPFRESRFWPAAAEAKLRFVAGIFDVKKDKSRIGSLAVLCRKNGLWTNIEMRNGSRLGWRVS